MFDESLWESTVIVEMSCQKYFATTVRVQKDSLQKLKPAAPLQAYWQ